MSKPLLLIALAALGASTLAGCDYERNDTFGPGFGNAIQNNRAAQIINPNPPAATQAPNLDGSLAVDAVDRYRTGRVRQPASTSISNIGGGTGGGGGGGTSGGASVTTGTGQ